MVNTLLWFDLELDEILKPILEDKEIRISKFVLFFYHYFDIKDEGVLFIIYGRTCHFCGTVTIVSADNPASAALGGFKESASTSRFCRHCLGTDTEIQTKVNMSALFMCLKLFFVEL